MNTHYSKFIIRIIRIIRIFVATLSYTHTSVENYLTGYNIEINDIIAVQNNTCLYLLYRSSTISSSSVAGAEKQSTEGGFEAADSDFV